MPSPLEVAITQFAENLDLVQEPSFATLLEVIHQARYTGRLVLHCQNGAPRAVELGQPIRIELQKPKKQEG